MMLFKRCFINILSIVIAASLSGYFFYGVGADSEALRYEKLLASANAEAQSKYQARKAELLALAELRVKQAKAVERQRKIEEEVVIRYVTNDKDFDTSGCAITHNGMQLIARYIDASFKPPD